MMSQHIRQDLLALTENRLRPVDRPRAEAHLAACPHCRAEAADMVQLVDSLEAMPLALRALTWGQARRWSAIWVQMRGPGVVRGPAPVAAPWPFSLSVSLVTILLALSATVPAGLARSPNSGAAREAQTPVIEWQTPSVHLGLEASGATPVLLHSTEPAALLTPAPIPTPLPGPHG